MHNLAPTHSGDIIVAPRPRIICTDTDITPLCDAGDNTVICYRDRELLQVDAQTGDSTTIAALPSKPLCAAVISDIIIVMTDSGPFRITRDAEGKLVPAGILPSTPPVMFSARSAGSYSADIAAVRVDSLPAAFVAAYSEMAAKASAAGLSVQPVMARYRLLDNAGRQLYVSQPVAVVPRGGAPLSSPLSFAYTTDDKGNRTTVATQLSLPAYALHYDIADTLSAPWADIVAAMEIQISPQFHPIASGSGQLSYSRDGDSVTLHHPGISRAMNPANMAACSARFEALAITVAKIPFPFRTATSADIPVTSSGTALSQADALATALSRGIDLSSPAATLQFSAQHCAVSSNTVAWAGIKSLHAPAPSPAVFALSTLAERRWTAVSRVKFANGDCVITAHSGSSAPQTLSPFIAYPEPDAVELAVSLTVDGVSRSIVVPLHNDPSGRFSIYTADSPTPVALSDDMLEIDLGEAYSFPVHDSYMVAVADSADPLVPLSYRRCVSAVNAIVPARSSDAAWDYGRNRFFVFTDTGTYRLISKSGAAGASISLMSGIRVKDCKHVAVGDDAVYALADGTLHALSGSAHKVLGSDIPGDIVAYSHVSRAIITADTNDNVARVYPLWLADKYKKLKLDVPYYTVDLCALAPDMTGPVFGLLNTSDGLTDIANPVNPDNNVPGCYIMLPFASAAKILTEYADATISVSRRYITDGRMAVLMRLNIKGKLTAPVRIPYPTAKPDNLRLTIHGTFSPRTIIGR